ncbi:radical SAM protein [Mucisphaera sp.]|uniref:radical SAM protein n=1 Tax=Mucisphaera sp. TaxID=2913024 RepID=UPI003D1369BF
MAFYEVTRACDLACRHCRACAQVHRDPAELTTAQGVALLEDLAGFEDRPQVVLTGGDPVRRPDLPELVARASELGLRPAVALSTTPRVTRERIERLQEEGLTALAVSLDGVDEATHRRLRQVPSTFERALRILADARELGLPTQVNTTITRDNVDQVDAMAELLGTLGIKRWSVFFLVPTGRGGLLARISPADYERVFERLMVQSRQQPYLIKTTEAPFYRRYVIERSGDPMLSAARMKMGVNDGRGVVFISHVGEINPSGFLPIDCGRFPDSSVVDVYRHHELFQALQDPDRLRGKCGVCPYRRVCGGSRSRAYAVTHDVLASEPDCAYVPPLAVRSLSKDADHV